MNCSLHVRVNVSLITQETLRLSQFWCVVAEVIYRTVRAEMNESSNQAESELDLDNTPEIMSDT